MIRVHAEVTLTCDAVTGSDALGDIYCPCRSTGRGLSVEAATAEAQRKATAAGWQLTARVGRDLCRAHAEPRVEAAP